VPILMLYSRRWRGSPAQPALVTKVV